MLTFLRDQIGIQFQDVPTQNVDPLGFFPGWALLALPLHFELFSIIGMLQCIDLMLSPIAVLLTTPLCITWIVLKSLTSNFSIRETAKAVSMSINPLHLVHLTLCVCVGFALSFIDQSWIYHTIRGRSMVKLFVLYNMLYVLERLCAAYSAESFKPKNDSSLNLVTSVRSFAYLLVHAFIIVLQISTLNASINSNDASAVAIVTSSNFLELRSSVMKRFSVQNVFQIGCADVVERFQILFFAFFIVTQGIVQAVSPVKLGMALEYFAWLMGSELLCDWMKHAFILKFNGYSSDIYRMYRYILVTDTVDTRKSILHHKTSTRCNFTSQRLGLSLLPYFSVLFSLFLQFAHKIKISLFLILACSLVAAILIAVYFLGNMFMVGEGCRILVQANTDASLAVWIKRLKPIYRYRLHDNSLPTY